MPGNGVYDQEYFDKLDYFTEMHELITGSGRPPSPDKATVELTMRCNLRCAMCFRAKPTGELDTDGFKAVIRNLRSLKKVHLTGGEIFLRDDIFEILDCLRDKEVSLNTNGTMLNEERVERLAKYDNISRIGISLDGIGALHDRIRGFKAAFEKTQHAIRLLSGEFPVVINTVVLDENLSGMDRILRLAKGLGVTEHRIELEMFSTMEDVIASEDLIGLDGGRIACQVKVKDEYDYQFEKFRETKENLKGLASRLRIKFSVGPKAADLDDRDFYRGDIREKKRLFCKHLLTARVDPMGNVVPCHIIRNGYGNLLDQNLDDIWGSEEFAGFRKMLLGNNLLPICKRCCRLRTI